MAQPEPEPIDPAILAFGQRLADIRQSKKREDPKWTQDFVAKKVGVRQEAVSKWETGEKEIGFANFAKLCEVLDCSADALLGRQVNVSADEVSRAISDLQRLLDRMRSWKSRAK